MIVINFKNYRHGKDALDLAKKVEKYCPDAIVAVSAFDLKSISEKTKLIVFAQHIDFFEGKRETGFLLSEGAKRAGAKGTLLNHSEHKLFPTHIKKTISVCRKQGLKVIVCVSDLHQLYDVLHLEPWAVAYEDPELIASGKSVTNYDSESVRKFAILMREHGKSISLCGAGISNVEDVKEAIKLGCDGVLIASAIADSKKPENLLKRLRKYG